MITPCIQICKIKPDTKLCEGCKRTLEEIANWSNYNDDQRRLIMEQLKNR